MSEFKRVPRNGRTIKEAAAITGLSERSIRRWTSEPRDVYLARSAAKRKQAQKLRKQGLSIRAIAKELGYSKSAVQRYISE